MTIAPVASMLAVAALPLANLGGLVIGTVAGIVGSGMVFAWTPYTDKQLVLVTSARKHRVLVTAH